MNLHKYTVKICNDNRVLLNLACGTIAHNDWNNIDFSPYAIISRYRKFAKILNKIKILSNKRYERLQNIISDIIYWDLRKGIPFENNNIDVIYCSHFLEHLKKEKVQYFLQECFRVLKINGIMRLVVPDLELAILDYIKFVDGCKKIENYDYKYHNALLENLFGQMVRREPVGTSEQNYFMRKIEYLIRGNADDVGELHNWIYDRYLLEYLLNGCGFKEYKILSCQKSNIKDWHKYNFDILDDGSERHPKSIYVECIKI